MKQSEGGLGDKIWNVKKKKKKSIARVLPNRKSQGALTLGIDWNRSKLWRVGAQEDFFPAMPGDHGMSIYSSVLKDSY